MASTALYLGAKMLDQVQNVGQIGELVQGQVHQKETLRWVRRAYQLDCQSIRLDAFDHAKDEIRSHHENYRGRMDTLLLVLALIWPFALSTIQFSDPFIPHTHECEDCIETKYVVVNFAWVSLMGLVLILPFWGILMLIRCKLKLDRWLDASFARIICEWRGVNIVPAWKSQKEGFGQDYFKEADFKDDTKDVVSKLVNIVAQCQKNLAKCWTDECGWLVHASTSLLWLSAAAAFMLTALSILIFLVNNGGDHPYCAYAFGLVVVVGLGAPLVYVLWQRSWDALEPLPLGTNGEALSLAQSLHDPRAFPVREERFNSADSACRSPCDTDANSPWLPPSNNSDADLPPRGETRDVNSTHAEVGIFRRRSSISSWFCKRRYSNGKRALKQSLIDPH